MPGTQLGAAHVPQTGGRPAWLEQVLTNGWGRRITWGLSKILETLGLYLLREVGAIAECCAVEGHGLVTFQQDPSNCCRVESRRGSKARVSAQKSHIRVAGLSAFLSRPVIDAPRLPQTAKTL